MLTKVNLITLGLILVNITNITYAVNQTNQTYTNQTNTTYENNTASEVTLFADNFDSGKYYWTTTDYQSNGEIYGLWHQETLWNTYVPFHNGTAWAYNTGNEGTRPYSIDVGTNFGGLISPIINLSGSSHPYLDFWEYYEINPSYHRRELRISVDGSLFETITVFPRQTIGQWVENGVDLTPYENYTVQIQFFLYAANDGYPSLHNYANDWWGWAIDDVSIKSEQYSQDNTNVSVSYDQID